MEFPPSSILVDSDILIDYLNGYPRIKEILDSQSIDIFYSTITRKELLSMPGLSTSERQWIIRLLAKHRMLRPDNSITEKFSLLMSKYAGKGLRKADALVAATAWAKRLPLLTQNKKHYQFLTEISLVELHSIPPPERA